MEKKRSLKYLIVSVCLALLVASIGGVIVGAGDSYKDNASLAIKGASLELDDKIALSFAVETAVAEGAELYIYDYDPTGTSDIGTPTTKTTKTIGGVEYALYVTDGFEATAVAETVYARLVNEETQEVGPVIKTGVYELTTMLLERLPAEAERTEAQTLRYNLYTAIIDYVEKAYTVINKTEHYPYHFIKVEDGYIVDHNGNKATQGVYNENYEITLVADGVKLEEIAYANNYYYSIECTGWESTGTAVKSATFKPFESATYSNPSFTQYNNDTSDITILKKSSTDGALGSEADGNGLYNWNELESGVRYPLPVFKGQTVSAYGGITYDAVKDAILIDAKDKPGKLFGDNNGTAHITMPNPTYTGGAATSNASVIEFNVMIPTPEDTDGDGEVDTTEFYAATGTGTSIFDMAVGYAATGNYGVHYNTRVLFHLLAYANTSNATNTVAGWAIGSNANGGAQNEGNTNGFTSNSTFGNAEYYELDREYNIKIVITSGTYDATTKTFTHAEGTGVGRADIYVDGALHHSRIFGAEKPGTSTYYEDQDYAINSGLTATRFTTERRIGIAAACAGAYANGFYVSDFVAYAAAPTAFDYENGAVIDTTGTDATKTYYTHANHKQAYTTDYVYAVARDFADLQSVDTAYVSYYDANRAPCTAKWNELNAATVGYGSKANGYAFTYNVDGDYITTTTTREVDGGFIVFGAQNPLNGITPETYNGEKIVYRFSFMVPNQDGDGDDILNEKYRDFMTNKSVLLSNMQFGFSDTNDFTNAAGHLVDLQMTRDSHSNDKDDGTVNVGFSIRTLGRSDGAKEADYLVYGKQAAINAEWFECIIVITPEVDGTIKYVDINLNGIWNRRTLDGRGQATLKYTSYANNLFSTENFGMKVNDKSTLLTSYYFKDFACYTIK